MHTLVDFVDSILERLNELSDATGIIKAILITDLYQRLTALKEGIQKDQEGHEKVKKFLEEQLRDAHRQLVGEEPLQTEYHLNLDEELNKEENQNGSETASS